MSKSEVDTIDTAPRDGTRVLLYGHYATGSNAWTIGGRSQHIDGDQHARWYGLEHFAEFFPTHWAPLPGVPQ